MAESNGEMAKPPGHALMEKMAAHAGELLQGVSSELPMVEIAPMKEGIKSYCGMIHKGISDLVSQHGKDYKGLKAPEWPDSLEKPVQAKEAATPVDDSKDEDDMADLEEEQGGEDADTGAADEGMSEEEEKSFTEQIDKLEKYVEVKGKELAAAAGQ